MGGVKSVSMATDTSDDVYLPVLVTAVLTFPTIVHYPELS